jgi:hypothetical protein
MSESWAAVAATVRERAADRCEYCLMHSKLQGGEFHIEHVLPSAKGGSDELENLALACPSCNLSKSDRVVLTDPDTGSSVPIFHPRRDRWTDHFTFSGHTIVGLTPTGRTTIAGLDLNHSRRLYIRQVEEMLGLFRPTP